MRSKIALSALAATVAVAAAPAQAASFLDHFDVTVEAPGAVTTSTTFLGTGAGVHFGVEDFDTRFLSDTSFTSDFGGSPISGLYENVQIVAAGMYGGAGNTGKYAVAGLDGPRSYSVTFTQTGETGINYFGYWLSALDQGNTLEFWRGEALLGTFDPANVRAFVGEPGSGSPYYGNPETGEVQHEPFVFVNFYNTTGTFDKIVFTQAPGSAGYESDNHTVGWFVEQGGTPVPGVPEPSTWAMMLLGFGAVGGFMRAHRRRARLSVKYA